MKRVLSFVLLLMLLVSAASAGSAGEAYSKAFKAMDKEEVIEFMDTPIDIRDKYQYFTEANMSKLLKAGYDKGFHTLEEGVSDYVKEYLMKDETY